MDFTCTLTEIILCDLQKEMREKNMNEDEIEVVLQEKQKVFKKEVRENFPYFYTNEILIITPYI